MKLRAPAGRGEAAIGIEPRGAVACAGRERPLLGTLVIEQRVAQPREVEVALGGQVLVFLEQRFAVGEIEQAGQAGAEQSFQATGEVAGDRPVGPRLFGRWHGAADMADAALGVGHRAFLLAPAGGGQQQVGVAAGLGGEEGLLNDNEGAGGQGLVHLVLVRQRLRRVGAGDPQRLDAAVVHRIEQLDGGQPRRLRQGVDAPVGGDFGAVFGIARLAVARQQVAQAAGLAAAHGVGLAGQREGTGAGLADLPGGQVQVDQRAVLRRTGAGLIQPHAPQREEGGRLADQLGAALQAVQADAADVGGGRRAVVAHQLLQRLEAFGMGVDIAAVDPAFPQQDMQDAVKQRHVGAGQDRQVQVGQLAGVGAPRIDDDDLHLGAASLGFFQAAEQHRVGVGHVGAGDQQAVASLDVFVTAGRGVGAEAALVADHRAGHAQARVGVDIVGADQGAGQLVEGVVILGQQLAGDIEGHAVRAVLADGLGEHRRGVVQGAVPVRAGAGQAFAQAQLGVQGAGIEVAGQVQGRALAAQFAEVGRVAGIAGDAEDLLAVVLDQHAAAHAAVAAGGGGDLALGRHGARLRGLRPAVGARGTLSSCWRSRPRKASPASWLLQFYAHFSAWFRASSTRPLSTLAWCRWAQPTSGATASPDSSSICQLCSGQATRLP